MGKFLSK